MENSDESLSDLQSFEEEFYAKRIADASGLTIPFEAKTAFLQYFKAGDGPSFFTLWSEHSPRDDTKAMLSLQLELHAYFHAWGPSTGKGQWLEGFQKFLREQGEQLALERDLVHFFALPHVSEPRSHPLFKELYTMEWREALRQKLEAFLDYRDPAKMMPLLHDMYRDFHTRLQEEFGAPGTASSFELAEADAKTAFTLGGTGGIRSNVNTIAANGQKNGMQDSVRRSRADWLRRLEQGGEQEQDFKHHPSENIIQVSQTPTEALVKSKPSSQEQRTNRGSVDGSTHRDSGCGALLDGARRPTESLEAGRPMSVRTRRDLLAGARQSVDSALEMERDRASFASFSVTDSFANRPFTGSSSIDASASNVASHGRPDSASHPPGKTGQELLLKSLYAQSGGGSVNWRGQLGPVSQSLAADPRSPDGAESRPMTGNGRRPPKNPSLPATGSDHEGLDETPSPKVAPSRSKRLSRTNSLGRSEAAEEATRLSIRRAHRGSRSMDLLDAHLNFEPSEAVQVVNGKDSLLNGKGFRSGGGTGELLRLDGSCVGQSGGLFRGFSEDVRDSFQALCNAHDVVRRSTHLSPERIEEDPEESVGGTTCADVDYENVRSTLYGGSDQEVATLLQGLVKHLLSSPKAFQETIGGDPFCFLTGRKQQRPLLALLFERGADVRHRLARALNALASNEAGRGYLLTDKNLMVDALVRMTRLSGKGTDASEALHNSLEALQKLSERRSVQKLMIRHEIIPDLTSLIGKSEPLDEYGLEHALALLMTLSLRTSGKRACERAPDAVLDALMERLESASPQVRTFVNGTLYSLLSRPKFRQAARQVDLAALLKAVAKRSDDTCARQIGHVLTQIQSTADGPDVSDSEGSSEGELLRPKTDDRRVVRTAPNKIPPPDSGSRRTGGQNGRREEGADPAHHLQPLSPNLRGKTSDQPSGSRVPLPAPKPTGKAQTARDDGFENHTSAPLNKRGNGELRRSTAPESGAQGTLRTSTEAFAARPKVPRTPELHSR